VSCADSQTVDAFVGCFNATYGTHFPREADIPPASSLHALYASGIARFVHKPGYLYWGEVGPPWTLFTAPTTFTVTTVVVYATGPQAERPGVRARLRALVRGRLGRAHP
jgi:hypothetical protein